MLEHSIELHSICLQVRTVFPLCHYGNPPGSQCLVVMILRAHYDITVSGCGEFIVTI